jgi:hypothetical protein
MMICEDAAFLLFFGRRCGDGTDENKYRVSTCGVSIKALKQLPLHYSGGDIETQEPGGGGSYVRKRLNERPSHTKVFSPAILPRVK